MDENTGYMMNERIIVNVKIVLVLLFKIRDFPALKYINICYVKSFEKFFKNQNLSK